MWKLFKLDWKNADVFCRFYWYFIIIFRHCWWVNKLNSMVKSNFVGNGIWVKREWRYLTAPHFDQYWITVNNFGALIQKQINITFSIVTFSYTSKSHIIDLLSTKNYKIKWKQLYFFLLPNWFYLKRQY